MKIVSQQISGKPISSVDDDEFGYAKFASHLANTVDNVIQPEGTVFAVYGPWGSGKTSLLFLLREELKGRKIVPVEFNAWSYSTSHDLVRRFFGQLISQLPHGRGWSNTAKALQDISELVGDDNQRSITQAARLEKYKLLKRTDLRELREQITEVLRVKNQRFVVFVDDFDRLDSREMLDLFSVIKSIADFPNIIYLLAFDLEVVESVISEHEKIDGQSYLDKIVQVGLHLPVPDRRQLGRALLKRCREIWGEELSKKIFQSQGFWHMFVKGVLPLISTPRQINRLAVSLSITFPAIKSEVDAVDFLGLETLRVLVPQVYEAIRIMPSAFAGMMMIRSEGYKEYHKNWMAVDEQRLGPSAYELVKFLFPKVESILDESKYFDKETDPLRVSSLRAFPSYFKLTVTEGVVSELQMREILSIAGEAGAFCEALRALSEEKQDDGNSKILSFFERLGDFYDDIPPEHVENILKALFELGDAVWICDDDVSKIEQELIHVDDSFLMAKLDFLGLHSTGPAYIVSNLLSKLEAPERVRLLTELLGDSSQLYVMITIARLVFRQSNRDDKSTCLLSVKDAQEFKDWTVSCISGLASVDKLFEVDFVKEVIEFWGYHDLPACKEWLAKISSRKSNLFKIIELFSVTSTSIGGSYPKKHSRLDKGELSRFFDLESLGRVAQEVLTDVSLTKDQKKAIQQLLSKSE